MKIRAALAAVGLVAAIIVGLVATAQTAGAITYGSTACASPRGDYFDTEGETSGPTVFGVIAALQTPQTDWICPGQTGPWTGDGAATVGAYSASWVALTSDNAVGGVIKIGEEFNAAQGCNEWWGEWNQGSAIGYGWYSFIYSGHCIPDGGTHILSIIGTHSVPGEASTYELRVDQTILGYTTFGPDNNDVGWSSPKVRLGSEQNYLQSNEPGNNTAATSFNNVQTASTPDGQMITMPSSFPMGLVNSNPSHWTGQRNAASSFSFYTGPGQNQ